MNNLIIPTIALTVVTGIGAYIFGSINNPKVYAYGGAYNGGVNMRQGLQDKANIFGISLDELNRLRASGKTMLQIAQDKGLSEDAFHQKVEDAAIANWKARGFTSQEIQDRLEQMDERQSNCNGVPRNGGMMGQGRGYYRD